jgi:hypothetical protein
MISRTRISLLRAYSRHSVPDFGRPGDNGMHVRPPRRDIASTALLCRSIAWGQPLDSRAELLPVVDRKLHPNKPGLWSKNDIKDGAMWQIAHTPDNLGDTARRSQSRRNYPERLAWGHAAGTSHPFPSILDRQGMRRSDAT